MRKIVIVFAVFISALMVASCSGSENSSSKTTDKKDSKETLKIFSDKVEAICGSVDENVVLSIALISSGATTDPSAMAETLKTSEEEMDRLISKLDQVDPPASLEEDWDSYLAENSEIRDTFPELSEVLIDLGKLNQKIIDDPESQLETFGEVEAINDDIDLIIRNLELRVNEIELLTKSMDIEECSSTVE